jgi:hypothetical protein
MRSHNGSRSSVGFYYPPKSTKLRSEGPKFPPDWACVLSGTGRLVHGRGEVVDSRGDVWEGFPVDLRIISRKVLYLQVPK